MFGFKCPEDGTEGREGERKGIKEGKRERETDGYWL